MHAWERRCHDKDNNRVVRPFEWGLEFLSPNPVIHHGEANGAAQAVAPLNQIEQFNERVIPNSHEFYLPAPSQPGDFDFDGFMLRFPSSITTISETNNTVYARFYPAQKNGKESDRAVIVMPQWNGDVNAHVAICQALNKFGISALRLSLPYHDWRKPPELERADYMVSANLGRTIQSVQQAVHDIRRSADWLQLHGIRSIGVMGTSVRIPSRHRRRRERPRTPSLRASPGHPVALLRRAGGRQARLEHEQVARPRVVRCRGDEHQRGLEPRRTRRVEGRLRSRAILPREQVSA